MTGRTVAAVDLGAESGRVSAVSFDGAQLDLQIVNRFEHAPSIRDGLLRWDIDQLWNSITAGLAELAGGDRPIASVGVDTWGIDYGLIDGAGHLMDGPVAYRDPRNTASFQRALDLVGGEKLYDATGTQVMGINTIFGLLADVLDRPERLAGASRLLMMPDVFHHLLSGSLVSEYTAVSTTGAYDMARNAWAVELLTTLGIPTAMLPEVVAPGTDVGPLSGPPATGALAGTRVIVPAGHDTASAVVAVPFVDPGALFISSGTWSLAGIEVPAAVVTAESRRANLTNEGGFQGTIRLLRNVMGLWILQQCRRQWAADGTALSYQEIADRAAAEPGLVTLINPDAPDFLAPGDMPARIRTYCARTGSVVPDSVGAVARCVLDSLALGYRQVVEDISRVTVNRPPSISVVGGGTNNTLLSQLTADATGLPVYAGPVEATALGNAAVQLVALGELGGLDQIREVIAASHQIRSYQPVQLDHWADAIGRFEALSAADHLELGPPATRQGA